MDAIDLARRFEDAGVAAIIYTDIDRDGVLAGLNIEATLALARAVSIPVIASGGLASLADVERLLEPDCAILEGAISGRALYDGRLDAAEALGLIRDGAGGGMMLKVRVIPCLDVKDGRVVKGVRFVDLDRCRRPGRGGARLRRRRRRRALLPRHHRQPREARHHPRRRGAHRRGLLHAGDRRRRRAHASRTCAR